ncbi:MAG: response regulator transcription factor [Anaerolineales bacterium]|nr:response regulator transcription factor [Anaerolineales bacterium]
MGEIRVVVVDDHPLFRQGVVDAMSLETDIRVIGEADNGNDALKMIEQLQPHVAILDVNLPGMNGLLLTRKIVAEKWPTRVVLLTAYDDLEQVIHAMQSGASAYMAKHVKPEDLVYTVRKAAAGKYIIGEDTLDRSEIARWLQSQVEGATRSYSDPGEPFHPLSNREMEVLSHLTRGMSNKEIASLLGISHQTVKNHVTSILRKLGVDDRTQAAVYALRRGWFRLHDHEQTSNHSQEQ